MSTPAGRLETAVPAPETPKAPEGSARAVRARLLPRRVVATLIVFLTLSTLGGSGVPFASAAAHRVQSQADALHVRWSEMVADGVPNTDLAALQAEWTGATQARIFGAGGGFWLPGAQATVDRWQAETDAIWNGNLATDRASALVAEGQLHQALGAEPAANRKERLIALSAATTPVELLALRADWDLQARLIPVDRRIAADFGKLTGLVARAAVLGIVSDPAPAILIDAKSYAELGPLSRIAHAERLVRDIGLVQADLGARLDAAALAKAAITRASAEISLGTAYGLAVPLHQARLDAGRNLYAAATNASQFAAVAADLTQSVAQIEQSINELRRGVHIVTGVRIYYQSHALSCEETATSMALTHQGIYLSQDQILREMGADLRPQYRDARGILRWGNPYISFVGNVNGVENRTGLQANYPALVRVALRHGARIIAYGNMSAEYVYARITAGHPVVVYATYDWAWHPRHDYLSFDGRWIPYIGPAASHVYTAIGVRPDAVLVNDPIRGQYWVAKAKFAAAYSDFNEAIAFA